MDKRICFALFIFLLVFFYGCIDNNEGKAITPFKEKTVIKDYFSVPAESTGIKIPVNKTISDYLEIPIKIKEPINSFSLNGTINLEDKAGSVVIELWTENKEPLLLLRASYPDNGIIELNDGCEETCLMKPVVPTKIKVFVDKAEISIDSFEYVSSFTKARFLATKEEINKGQQKKIIDKFNSVDNRLWIASTTELSGLSYAEKKEILLLEETEPLLNDGIFYFVAGYFHYGPLPENPPEKLQKTESVYDLPEEFDWRDKHNARNPGSPYYDIPQVIDGIQRVADGWLTPVKDQGSLGSCWTFAWIGAREATINLFFNQHINQDLSEQYLVSCNEEQYTAVDEDCFPYQAFDGECTNYYGGIQDPCVSRCEDLTGYWGCTDWEQRVWRVEANNKTLSYYPETPENDYRVKEYLLEFGPLRFSTCYFSHAQVLVGYGIIQPGEIYAFDDDGERQSILIEEDNPWVGETHWTVKNSWGYDWAGSYGDPGYMNWIDSCFVVQGNLIPVEQPLLTDYVIECNDFDNDSYCSWGLSYSELGPESKPDSCPESCINNPEEDFDDSTPGITSIYLPRCGDGIVSTGEQCESLYFPFENYEGCFLDTVPSNYSGCNAEKKAFYWYEDDFGTCSAGCSCTPDPQISSCSYDGSCPLGTELYCTECFQLSCVDGVRNCGETAVDSGGHCVEILVDSVPSDAMVSIISEQDSSSSSMYFSRFYQANTPFSKSISKGQHILIVSDDPVSGHEPFVATVNAYSDEVIDLGTVNLSQNQLTCIDSDNGENYGSFGATIVYSSDYAFSETIVDRIDYCSSLSRLREAYCNPSTGMGAYLTYYCESGGICRDGHCTTECIDGTSINQCSSLKPLYCSDSLSLINDCQLCGCPFDSDCLENGTCFQENNFVCGDIDGSLGIPDISDLIYLVNWMFQDGEEPISLWTANVDGEEGVDIADLIHLVNYMFQDGDELNCQEPMKSGYSTNGLTYKEAISLINKTAGKKIIE